MAQIVALVVQTGGRGGSADVTLQRREPSRFRLVAVQERNAEEPGACLVFLLRDAELPVTATDRLAGLTPREREVAQHAANGLRSWEVAERLGCRERTVRAHLQSTYLKLGIKTRVELAKLISRTR
jgi:DNA-binding CsgD family transcriptional regulator